MNEAKNSNINISVKKLRSEIVKEYENRAKWVEVGNFLKQRVGETPISHPILNKIMKLCMLANMGIWTVFIFLIFSL